ncbi:MAG TPA: S8 family serine peptidase [Caulobacterales bacterium]|nr:S8 family serine peptidase [Caulobacterales bacterium]
MTRRAGMALALMCLLGVASCDQIGAIWDRLTGQRAGGPTRLDRTPLDARALSGSVLPQDAMAAVTAPQPLTAAAGELLVGARVEDELAEAARDLRLGADAVRAVRERGFAGLGDLPPEFAARVRARAGAMADETAERAARVVLERLGLRGVVTVQPAGIVKITLAHQAIPAAEAAGPRAIAWTDADACPHLITQDELEGDVALATRCMLKALAGSRRFAFVEPNYIAVVSAAPPSAAAPDAAPQTVANDPLLALQWNFRVRGSGPGLSSGGAGFAAFWAAHHVGSRQVRVAVVDTGLDLTNPDIHGSANVGRGIDVIADPLRAGDGDGVDGDVQDAGDACEATDAPSYHGTHVAGIIGAAVTNNHVGVAGGAWAVTVIPVRALGRCGGTLGDIVNGVNWAAGVAPALAQNGAELVNTAPADIINLSFSIEASCPASLQAAIDAATSRGALIVAAAGDRADQARYYAPANCRDVIVVGASDAKGELAFYSNFGPELDLIAPGGDMFADADRDGRPDGVLSTRATQSGCYDPLNQSVAPRCYYSFMQGASMAAPHVSAALALLAAETGLRGTKLREALMMRAVSPFPAGFGQIECARVHNATPNSGLCARPSGRGYLDLARAARSSH